MYQPIFRKKKVDLVGSKPVINGQKCEDYVTAYCLSCRMRQNKNPINLFTKAHAKAASLIK